MSCSHCNCGHDKTKPHGSGHWLAERITSMALAPLGLWIVWSMITLRGATYADFTAWLATPLNAGLVIAAIVIGFWHGMMGMQVILEDYVSTAKTRQRLVCLMKLFFGAVALVSLYSVYKVAF